MNAVRVKLCEVERFERDVRLRLPFRFGVTTVTHGRQAVIRARIELEDGRTEWGVASESLASKWFDKSPALTDAQNLDQLRQSLDVATDLYRAAGFDTPFGLAMGAYAQSIARMAALGSGPLVASYGPALLDRAILDALGRLLGLSFAQIIAGNLIGAGDTPHAADLEGFDWPGFLAGLRPAPQIAVRHTVGLVDPISASDQSTAERVNDGLPETLEEVVRAYRGRYYKLKVMGDPKADHERLSRIAAVLDAGAGDYSVTLDGNEQYDSVEGIAELWASLKAAPALQRLAAATLYIEQPIKRAVALARPVDALAKSIPLIIDESDADLSSFIEARQKGYSGVSSKIGKGLYKSIVNAARVARWNHEAGERRFFMSAEDLTTWPGVSVQQDLALVSLIGLTHVERNAHHFIDGMSFAPRHEQAAFAAAHPGLYDMSSGTARMRVREGGLLDLASLACPGFAVGADLDFTSMTPMPDAPDGRIG